MKMCYRGVEYDHSSVILNLKEQQKEAINRSLADAPTLQMKFLGRFFDKQILSLPVKDKNIRFLGRVSDRSVANHSKSKAIA